MQKLARMAILRRGAVVYLLHRQADLDDAPFQSARHGRIERGKQARHPGGAASPPRSRRDSTLSMGRRRCSRSQRMRALRSSRSRSRNAGIYAHLFRKRDDKAADAINKALAGFGAP